MDGYFYLDYVNGIMQRLGIGGESFDDVDRCVVLICIVLFAYLVDFLFHNVIVRLLTRFIEKTKNKWDDLLLDHKILQRGVSILPIVLIYFLSPLAFVSGSLSLVWTRRICGLVFVYMILRLAFSLINLVADVVHKSERYKDQSLKGVFQITKIIVGFVGIIIFVAILIGKSPTSLFAGLGASAAILMLVFKDTILGFVSGVQLSANNMLKVGDWITAPKSNANGVVTEITLNTIKVQNFDNTIVTIPPYSLISDSFQNWRGMQESAGRRIERSINIDMTSVKFCTPEMIEKFKKIGLLTDYIIEKEKEIRQYNKANRIDESVLANGRRQTNLGVFRAYLESYICSLPSTNKDLLHMVRQLQPTEKGIPIEVYFFTTIKKWDDYEHVICDVFDHLLAIIPEFELKVYQAPSGSDFAKVSASVASR